jgi:hypothetical protein
MRLGLSDWTMRLVAGLVLGALQIGCVYVGTARQPIAVDEEFRSTGDMPTKLDTPEYSVEIRFDGFSGRDLVFFGLLVPIIPIGQWEWLTGIGAEDLRVKIDLRLLPKTTLGRFSPASLRLLEGGREYRPTEVRKGSYCPRDSAFAMDGVPDTIVVSEQLCFEFSFRNLRPPAEQFSLAIDGLPIVAFRVERRFIGGLATQ